VIGGEEECILRDHLLVVHPMTLQPHKRSMLLRHFVITEGVGAGRVNPAGRLASA